MKFEVGVVRMTEEGNERPPGNRCSESKQPAYRTAPELQASATPLSPVNMQGSD